MRKLFAAGVMLFCLNFSLQASPISGRLDIAGFANEVVSPSALDFLCSSTGVAAVLAPCAAGPAGAGNFITTAGTGSFAPYITQGGYDKDLNQAIAPVNEPFLLPDFITFASTPANPVVPPDLALDLTFIFPGVSGQADCLLPPAPGQTCTPIVPALITPANPLGLSPYNLQNLAGGKSTASFAVAGIIRRLSTGESVGFSGSFTSPLTVPYQTVLAAIAAGGTFSAPYSGTFVAIPEPNAGELMLAGFLVLGLAGLARKFVIAR